MLPAMQLTLVVSSRLLLPLGGRGEATEVFITRVPVALPRRVPLPVADPNLGQQSHNGQVPLLSRGGRLLRRLCLHLRLPESGRLAGHHRVSGEGGAG